MNNNILLFRSYIVISLLLLLPLSMYLTLELWQIFQFILFKQINLDKNNYLRILNVYIDRKKWLLCISFLEVSSLFNVIAMDINLMYLAYCYRNLNYYNIAEYYYLKAIFYSPCNIIILSNLASMYNLLGRKNDAINLYRQIYSLDSSYSIPENYISDL
uniref:Uncharacterized protein n=1 Tax=Sonderella linearis TaxID=110477 RepID=A0A1Z1MM61_9FLOR|nr:hypothetical protein [Sonderella linearis]ARW66939.1 hypothetical protein [Sonderella linearis]